MRLSPSTLRRWREDDRETFYMQMLTRTRTPQTKQQATGSSFDAHVKSALKIDLGGEDIFTQLFEKQVEVQHRDTALAQGKYLLDCYKASGAYGILRSILSRAEDVNFEGNVTGEIEGIPFTGQPDLSFWFEGLVVVDWKLKGFFSSASPSKCYVKCIDSWTDAKPSRKNGCSHPSCRLGEARGMQIHTGSMEDSSPLYADQLGIYSLLLGDPNALCWIEELCCAKQRIRVATHRAIVSSEYQAQLVADAKECWAAIQSGHIFTDLTRSENDARCATLNAVARHMRIEDPNYVCAV